MFDHDASSDLLSSRPSLYYVGSKGTLYRNWSFWVNILEALYVSLVVFFIAFGMPLFHCIISKIRFRLSKVFSSCTKKIKLKVV